ncbi:MAG TPA: ATP-binding protein [Candidatus Nanopelagicales bacterium]|nr:ATP-binding protein [Candidatus Nanopelagicales bacterium]
MLLGVNGAGKTTVLDAIAHAFESLDGSSGMGASPLDAADVRNVQDPLLNPAADARTGSVTLAGTLSEEELRAIRPLYENAPATGILHFGIGHQDLFEDLLDPELPPNLEDVPLGDDDDEPFETDFEGSARAALSQVYPSCVFLPADRGVLEHREDLTLKEIVNFEPRRGCLSRARDRFAPVAARLALATIGGGRSDAERSVARMWKVIEKYFPEMPRLVGAEGMVLRFRSKSGAVVPLSALSDGERAILLIFGELALRGPRSGMVLIDEVEQHLHPRWQRAVLQGLLALLPSAQFIITTQSPYLAACAPDDVVKLGDWDRDGE